MAGLTRCISRKRPNFYPRYRGAPIINFITASDTCCLLPHILNNHRQSVYPKVFRTRKPTTSPTVTTTRVPKITSNGVHELNSRGGLSLWPPLRRSDSGLVSGSWCQPRRDGTWPDKFPGTDSRAHPDLQFLCGDNSPVTAAISGRSRSLGGVCDDQYKVSGDFRIKLLR